MIKKVFLLIALYVAWHVYSFEKLVSLLQKKKHHGSCNADEDDQVVSLALVRFQDTQYDKKINRLQYYERLLQEAEAKRIHLFDTLNENGELPCNHQLIIQLNKDIRAINRTIVALDTKIQALRIKE
jgi:hypothetical protein